MTKKWNSIWSLTGSDRVLRLTIMVSTGLSIVAFLYLAHRRRPARTNVVAVANCGAGFYGFDEKEE